MQSGRSRISMEIHADDNWDWTGTYRHGKSYWDPSWSNGQYIKEWYRATKGRDSKAFRYSKSREKK